MKITMSGDDSVSSTSTPPLQSPKKIFHTPKPNRNSPLGHDYEIYILTLSCLHSWMKIKENEINIHQTESFIGAELDEVKPFEDVAHVEIEQGKARTIFLQAKHIDGKKILDMSNFSSPGKNPPFGTVKYFKAYLEIMKDFDPLKKIKNKTTVTSESYEFVIFTNWTLDENDVKGLEPLSKNHLFFMSAEMKGKLFRVKTDDVPDTLYSKTKGEIMKNMPNVTKDQIKDFFNHLILAVNQLNVSELRQRIEEKLSKITGLRDTEWIADILYSRLSQWSHQKKAWYLTNRDFGNFFEYVNQHLANWGYASLTSLKIDSLLQYGARFQQSAEFVKLQNFLSESNKFQQIAVVHYEELLLTEIKIAQVIEETHEAIFCDLMSLKVGGCNNKLNSLEAFSSKGSNQLLIIIRKHSEFETHKKIIQAFFEIIQSNSNKKIVFIIPAILRGTVSHVIGRNHAAFNDEENSFSNLEDTSQENISRLRNIVLQNYNVRLSLILNDCLKKKIRGEILSKLIKGDIVVQEVLLEKKFDEAKEYYVPQALFRKITINSDVTLKDNFDIIKPPFTDFESLTKEDIIIITEKKDKRDFSPTFEVLCSKYNKNNIHWLLEDSYSLLWKQSQGSINKIRKYAVSQNYVSPFAFHDPGDDEDECNRLHKIDVSSVDDVKDKMVVIGADPGMGKSLFLSHLAYQMRTQTLSDGDPFVIKINLIDHHKCSVKGLSPQDQNAINIVDFLFNADSPKRQGYLYKLLELEGDKIKLAATCLQLDTLSLLKVAAFIHLYNQKQIVVLLDGFDEIAPKNTEKFLNILKVLVGSNVNGIWLTSRPCNILNELNYYLNTFSYSLQGLWELREMFIEKYLNCQIKLGPDFGFSQPQIDSIKSIMKNRISNHFIDDDNFLSIPMHIKMTIDIYIEDVKNKLCTNNIVKVEDIEIVRDINLLYKKYTEKKIEKLVGQDLSLLGTAGEILIKGTVENHRKLALLELFPDSLLTKAIIPENEREKLIEDVLSASEKTGLVVPVWGGTPRFIHRTFAEYYVADLLADLIRNEDVIHAQNAKQFLYNLLVSNEEIYTDEPNVIMSVRSIYDKLLEFFNYNIIADDENYNYFVKILDGTSDATELSDVSNICDILGRTPLHLLFCRNQFLDEEALGEIESGFFFTSDKLFRWTPLHYAAALHSTNLELLDTKQKISVSASILQDMYGRTPLMLAITNDHASSFFTFELPITYRVEDCDQNSALHYICSKSFSINFKEFLNLDFDFFKPNKKGETPFELLLNNGSIEDFEQISECNNKVITDFLERCKNPGMIVKCISKCKYVIINKLVDAALCDDEGKTALHHVATSGDGMKMAAFLLEHQELVDQINKPDRNHKTALHYAAAVADFKLIGLLLERGADADAIDKCNNKPVYYIIQHENRLKTLNKYPDCAYLYNSGKFWSSIVTQSNINNSLVSILSKHKYFVTYLIDRNLVSVDIEDEKGRTALHYAVASGDTEMICILIKYQADLYKKDKNGNIPADLIFESSHLRSLKEFNEGLFRLLNKSDRNASQAILEQFLFSFKDVNKRKLIPALGFYKNIATYLYENNIVDVNEDYEGKSALHYAAINDLDDNVEFLILHGAYFDTVSEESIKPNTLLHFIAELFSGVKEEQLCHVETAITETSPLEIVNLKSKNNDRTPLHFAVETDNREIIEYLLSCGACYNIPDRKGVVASDLTQNIEVVQLFKKTNELFKAVEEDDVVKIKDCVKNGAHVNAKDYKRDGVQPLHLATKLGNCNVVDVLIQLGADIEGQTLKRATIYHFICKYDRINIFEMNLPDADLRLFFTCKDAKGQVPFQKAVMGNSIKILRLIMKRIKFEEALKIFGWSVMYDLHDDIGRIQCCDEIKKMIEDYFCFGTALLSIAIPVLYKLVSGLTSSYKDSDIQSGPRSSSLFGSDSESSSGSSPLIISPQLEAGDAGETADNIDT